MVVLPAAVFHLLLLMVAPGGKLLFPTWDSNDTATDLAIAYEKAATVILDARSTYLIIAQVSTKLHALPMLGSAIHRYMPWLTMLLLLSASRRCAARFIVLVGAGLHMSPVHRCQGGNAADLASCTWHAPVAGSADSLAWWLR
jgi:hypothetical protein